MEWKKKGSLDRKEDEEKSMKQQGKERGWE